MRPYAHRVRPGGSSDRASPRTPRSRRAGWLAVVAIVLGVVALAVPPVYLHAESRITAESQRQFVTDGADRVGWILWRRSLTPRTLLATDLHDPHAPEDWYPNPHAVWTRMLFPLWHVPTNSTAGTFGVSWYDLYGFPWPLVSVERLPGGRSIIRPLELPIVLFVLWIGCVVGAFVAGGRAVLRVRRRGRCPACGYDLRGLASCPECGHVSPREPTANRTDDSAQP